MITCVDYLRFLGYHSLGHVPGRILDGHYGVVFIHLIARVLRHSSYSQTMGCGLWIGCNESVGTRDAWQACLSR